MIFTDENRTLTICQTTEHAMLVPWGRFSRFLKLGKRLRAAAAPRCHQDATSGGDLILEFGLASLAGYEHLEDLNLGPHPLAKDQAVQDAWDIQFRHYTTVSRYLYELNESDADRVQAELEAIMQPYIRSAVHEVLCQRECLTLCGDLTGRPVSAYSSTYPPDAVFGYMANRLEKGHQAALVTLQGMNHGCISGIVSTFVLLRSGALLVSGVGSSSEAGQVLIRRFLPLFLGQFGLVAALRPPSQCFWLLNRIGIL